MDVGVTWGVSWDVCGASGGARGLLEVELKAAPVGGRLALAPVPLGQNNSLRARVAPERVAAVGVHVVPVVGLGRGWGWGEGLWLGWAVRGWVRVSP